MKLHRKLRWTNMETRFQIKRRRHGFALVFAIALIVMVGFEFLSFAVGAYIVYNQPVSNVVAETFHSNGQSFLIVSANSLQNNSARTVWVDPTFSHDSNGYLAVNPNSGYKIENASTDDAGNLVGNFTLSTGDLNGVSSDGQTVHSVWIIGLGSKTWDQSGQQIFLLTSDSERNYSSASQSQGVVLFVTLLSFVVPFQHSLGQIFLLLWTIYIVLFAIALNGPIKNLAGTVKHAWDEGFSFVSDNSILGMVVAFPVVLWTTVISALVQQAGGVPSGSLPPLDGLLLYVELSLAPLREEIGFRMIPIGLVALLLLLSRGRVKDGIMSLWHPMRYLKKNDSEKELKRHLLYMYVMIGISAFLFGLAHVLSGGWGPGKVLDAAIAGVALGYLYLYLGFPAAVLLHWSIDVFLTTFDPGLNPSYQGVYEFVYFYTIVLAIISSVVLAVLLARRLRKRPSLGRLQPPGFSGNVVG